MICCDEVMNVRSLYLVIHLYVTKAHTHVIILGAFLLCRRHSQAIRCNIHNTDQTELCALIKVKS